MIQRLILIQFLFLNFLFANAQVPSYVPTNGLVGYWPFNGNANDDSGNGNNGTMNGATLTTDRFGNNNSAYNFVKANNNYITMNNTVGNFGTSDFSISAWYSSTDNISSHIINKRFSQSWGNYWELTKFLFGINDTNNNSNYNVINNNQAQSTNTWYNITITRNATSLKYYINGLLYQTITTTVINNISNTSNLVIGAVLTPLNGVLQSHDGKIDDIGIWNRALTPQEIANLYNSCNTPAPSGNLTQNDSNLTSNVNLQSSRNKFPNSTLEDLTIDGRTIKSKLEKIFLDLYSKAYAMEIKNSLLNKSTTKTEDYIVNELVEVKNTVDEWLGGPMTKSQLAEFLAINKTTVNEVKTSLGLMSTLFKNSSSSSSSSSYSSKSSSSVSYSNSSSKSTSSSMSKPKVISDNPKKSNDKKVDLSTEIITQSVSCKFCNSTVTVQRNVPKSPEFKSSFNESGGITSSMCWKCNKTSSFNYEIRAGKFVRIY